jgi:hypothetical protein
LNNFQTNVQQNQINLQIQQQQQLNLQLQQQQQLNIQLQEQIKNPQQTPDLTKQLGLGNERDLRYKLYSLRKFSK